jgi:iron complex transport system substrate-binding protein
VKILTLERIHTLTFAWRATTFVPMRACRTAAVGIALVALTFVASVARGAPPQRIISLAPSITEILFALGVGDRVVGVSTYCDYPPEATRIDRIGTFLQPNVERILEKRPDLVIGVPSPSNRAPVERLEDLGLHVLIVDPERIAAIQAAIHTIADAVGVPAAGDTLVADMRRQIDAVTARLDGAPRLSVLMLVGRSPFIAAGAGTYQDELITLAHGDNLAAPTGEAWPTVNLEFIVARGPQVIIDASMGSEEAPDRDSAMSFWSGFATIPAVRDRHIYGYRAYELLRPGPRAAATLARVARFIHPERFADQPAK